MKNRKHGTKSVRRGEFLTKMLIAVFLTGMCILVFKIVSEASFYMGHSKNVSLGCIYDRNGSVLYDPDATAETYGYDYFIDIGNLVGDDSGMMTNTLVSENLDKLANYDPIFGVMENGKSALYSTLDHDANRAVYNAFGSYNGTVIAYDYTTGEILVCVSKPNVNVLDYGDVESLPSGSFMCKAFYGVVPGSTQKIATLAAAIDELGWDTVAGHRFTCEGVYYNNYKNRIDCHRKMGHGSQDIVKAFQNSCNPYFAQLVEEMTLDSIIETYKDMGYSVNGSKARKLEIDGISVFRGSTELADVNEFDTQWGCMGQSKTLVSPCQIMMWQSAIANNSDSVTMPYLISSSLDMFGDEKDEARTTYEKSGFSAESAAYVKAVMLANGEARYNSKFGCKVGAKSGTAQVKDGAQENSLLAGFIDDPARPIAFCAVAENTGGDSSVVEKVVAALIVSLS